MKTQKCEKCGETLKGRDMYQLTITRAFHNMEVHNAASGGTQR